MEGISFNEFHEQLYHGCDISMKDKNWHYMIYSAYTEEGRHSLRVWKFDTLDNDSKYSEELYNHVSSDAENNISLFLDAKIFDGKSFLEVESNIVIEEIW